MARSQQKRTDFTREEFIDKVWEWKAESGGTITRQLRRLGCSMDWANERFTMDAGFSHGRAQGVRRSLQPGPALPRQAAGELGPGPQDRDLRSRGRDARDQRASSGTSAIRSRTAAGFISVATTRPETMLADMAVAVNPEDARYTRADRQAGQAADHRPADPDRRRRACRSRARLGRGQDHAGARLQRLRGGQARRVQGRRDAQHARCRGEASSQTADGLIPRRLARPRPVRGAQAGASMRSEAGGRRSRTGRGPRRSRRPLATAPAW